MYYRQKVFCTAKLWQLSMYLNLNEHTQKHTLNYMASTLLKYPCLSLLSSFPM